MGFAVDGYVTTRGSISCSIRTQPAEEHDREKECSWKPMTVNHIDEEKESTNADGSSYSRELSPVSSTILQIPTATFPTGCGSPKSTADNNNV